MKEQCNSGFSRFLRRFFFRLLILTVSMFSMLLPAFLFSPVKKAPEKEITDRRFTVMLNQTPTILNDPYDLAYWLIYCDPRSFAQPDWETGFSSFLRGGKRFSAIQGDFAENLSLTSSFASPETAFVSENRTPDQLFSRLRPAVPRPLPDLPDKANKEKPRFPRWSDLAGNDLGDLFGENQKFLSYLRRKTPKGSTVLRIDRQNSEYMPLSVRVVDSCGNRNLDMLASRALASAAVRNLNSALFARIRFVVVDWTMRTEEEIKWFL